MTTEMINNSALNSDWTNPLL